MILKPCISEEAGVVFKRMKDHEIVSLFFEKKKKNSKKKSKRQTRKETKTRFIHKLKK